MLEYDILRIIWWLLLGILLIGFAITDGFDLGVAMLMPFIGKTDSERRIIINTIGPVWEGNQVWLILGGGAIFAAWPMIYAVAFSGFYLAMLIVLFALILRPVGFKFRSKMPHGLWRGMWDMALFIGGFTPALIFGVALGNVIQGVPFHFDPEMRIFYTGTFFGLLNPFALLCGITSVTMVLMHGGIYLAMKTLPPIAIRALICSKYAAFSLLLLFLCGGVWLSVSQVGYEVSSVVSVNGVSDPLHKTVVLQSWLNNYVNRPWISAAPILAFCGIIITWMLCIKKKLGFAFITSSLAMVGIIATFGFTMYPFLLPSSSLPDHSLLLWDASSSQFTLFLMLIAVVIFMPIVLLYTSWVYTILRGKVTQQSVNEDFNSY